MTRPPYQPGESFELDGMRFHVDGIRPLQRGDHAYELTNIDTGEPYLASSFGGGVIGQLIKKDTKEFAQPPRHRISTGKL